MTVELFDYAFPGDMSTQAIERNVTAGGIVE